MKHTFEFISIEDYLPKENTYVLLAGSHFDDFSRIVIFAIGRLQASQWYPDIDYIDGEYIEVTINRVTHWAPLPFNILEGK